jgi:hypothetical protein
MLTQYKTIKTPYEDDFDRELTDVMSRDDAKIVFIGTEIAQGHKPSYAMVYQVSVVSYPTY